MSYDESETRMVRVPIAGYMDFYVTPEPEPGSDDFDGMVMEKAYRLLFDDSVVSITAEVMQYSIEPVDRIVQGNFSYVDCLEIEDMGVE